MRQTVCLLAALLVLPSLGSDSPKEYNDKTEQNDIEGTWEVIPQGNVKRLGPDDVYLHTFRGGRWEFSQDGGGTVSMRGTYRIDRGRLPASLDRTITFGDHIFGNYTGSTWRTIYGIDGDTLQMGFHFGNLDRPATFAEEGVMIGIWKRVRK